MRIRRMKMMDSTVRFWNEFQTAARTQSSLQGKDLKTWVADPTEGKEIYPNYWTAKGWRCVKIPYRQ
jgi:hypothetical protein